ncbi:hypothetical protein ERO13_D02G170300v2 [Gossypium hirsutum]|uniref:Uncharacterized protein n=4 Tax=Gossypium TaxID=3633 RepID=A0A5J5SET8_GOSBA|nr:hypothetical protein ES319_D02G196100v1 [Gossypium barbadense]KAG4159342.1 hypothetical protein ERO13_D02G170300v2 [Gossypium hirsutum]TYG80374.1 hypothetical protein ES288_D02G211200v1 [Gossypium darwinii]TYH84705.1 hypothetical protein ES332_D02G214500v1 [Gossypium tomentosum]TYI94399.1 hypothetical protein E1A91_D02G201100v1 [Gossypium mustelinum]
MTRQLVVLALVLIALAGLVSVDASSASGSPASAPTEASIDGSTASSSPPSQATAPSRSSGVTFDLDR